MRPHVRCLSVDPLIRWYSMIVLKFNILDRKKKTKRIYLWMLDKAMQNNILTIVVTHDNKRFWFHHPLLTPSRFYLAACNLWPTKFPFCAQFSLPFIIRSSKDIILMTKLQLCQSLKEIFWKGDDVFQNMKEKKRKRRPRASNGQRYPLPCCTHFRNLKCEQQVEWYYWP